MDGGPKFMIIKIAAKQYTDSSFSSIYYYDHYLYLLVEIFLVGAEGLISFQVYGT